MSKSARSIYVGARCRCRSRSERPIKKSQVPFLTFPPPIDLERQTPFVLRLKKSQPHAARSHSAVISCIHLSTCMYVFKSLASHDSTELLHRPDSRDGFSVVFLAFCLHGNSDENTFCPTAQIAVILNYYTRPCNHKESYQRSDQVSICYST